VRLWRYGSFCGKPEPERKETFTPEIIVHVDLEKGTTATVGEKNVQVVTAPVTSCGEEGTEHLNNTTIK